MVSLTRHLCVFGILTISSSAVLQTSGAILSLKFARVYNNFKANLTASMLLSEKQVGSTQVCSTSCFNDPSCYGFEVSPYVATVFQPSGVRSSVLCRLINGDGIVNASNVPRVAEAGSGIYWIQRSFSSKIYFPRF